MSKICEIAACRACGGGHLTTTLDLGSQALTGIFPQSGGTAPPKSPLNLVWCADCGLVQLRHSYSLADMYGDNYGYRSGLNQSMIKHLNDKISALQRLRPLQQGDTVLDIGSNDSTTLQAYKVAGLKRIGIDPTGDKFQQYYPPDIKLVSDFFTADNFRQVTNQKAKIITSIAMFYDLEDPVGFVNEIAEILADDGIWHFEQSYMPSMLRLNSYDTICHEHLEYYSLAVIRFIIEKAGLKILDVVMNGVNGGNCGQAVIDHAA